MAKKTKRKGRFKGSLPKPSRRMIGGALSLLLIVYWFSLPAKLFDSPLSTVLEDRNGELLGARIASDGQWRFPALDSVPDKFSRAIVAFEDKRFWRHPGVDLRALGRAFRQNARAGRIVSGGSTISMQLMRMARGNKARTVLQKIIESILATRLELKYQKKEILALYASHAPFGGNVVGLEAASWRYFSKGPHLLSWGEAATLAVLPNSPGLIHPGRNRPYLLAKRNRLLNKLYQNGAIDSISWALACGEPLPEQPFPLPNLAPHLLDRLAAGKQAKVRSTLDGAIQRQVNVVLQRNRQLLKHNDVNNLAALILDVPSGEAIAYVGNAPGAGGEHSEAVDIIQAPRSTGSILKPILYALMLQEGALLPSQLISDVPTLISGYQPENFHASYDGAVRAERALTRSLNVPFVLMLQDYGVEKFHYELQKLGFSYINQPPDHYGLSLILGGAEASLWQITAAYASMSRTLDRFYTFDGAYSTKDFRSAHYNLKETPQKTSINKNALTREAPYLSASAIWLSFEAMRRLERPGAEGDWEAFSSSRTIAWKTGTSFGFRDAWAVGVDARYAVGVWVGNADGEGRPGLVGVKAAAPVLFDLFDILPSGAWYDPPYDELSALTVCSKSGYRPLPICPIDTIWAPTAGKNAQPCPYHRNVHLDESREWQIDRSCATGETLTTRSYFVLPPVLEYYYKKRNPDYEAPPPLRADCAGQSLESGYENMQLIYPKAGAEIYLPLDFNGKTSEIIFKAAHRLSETIIYWHLDEKYMGSTQTFHQMALKPAPGVHRLTLVDQLGRRLSCVFEILE